MLTLLCGVSGVGKSTIIEILASEYSWKVITTYMTRKVREGENYKVNLSENEFNDKKNKDYFLCVNEVYGSRYGTPLHQIEKASFQDEQLWVMDFPFTKIQEVFSGFPHLCIVIQPESSDQLIAQLTRGGRAERASKALEDLRLNHVTVLKSHKNTYEVINEYGNPNKAALNIDHLAKAHI